MIILPKMSGGDGYLSKIFTVISIIAILAIIMFIGAIITSAPLSH